MEISLSSKEITKLAVEIVKAQAEADELRRKQYKPKVKWIDYKIVRMTRLPSKLDNHLHHLSSKRLYDIVDFTGQHAVKYNALKIDAVNQFKHNEFQSKKIGFYYGSCDSKIIKMYWGGTPEFRSKIIRHNNGIYVRFTQDIEGYLLLGYTFLFLCNDDTLLRETILEHLTSLYKFDKGESDTSGYEVMIEKCMNILTTTNPLIGKRHILLAGPPGTGKSAIVKKLVSNTEDWLHINIDVRLDWQTAIPTINEVAKHCNKNIMVIIDEVDQIGLSRDHPKSDVFRLLRMLDGVGRFDNITFVATTNRLKDLDEALLRVGRFGPPLIVNKPTDNQIQSIISYYAKKFSVDVDTNRISIECNGLTGCDIRNAFEECLINNQSITTNHIISNIQSIKKDNEFINNPNSEYYV